MTNTKENPPEPSGFVFPPMGSRVRNPYSGELADVLGHEWVDGQPALRVRYSGRYPMTAMAAGFKWEITYYVRVNGSYVMGPFGTELFAERWAAEQRRIKRGTRCEVTPVTEMGPEDFR